MTTYQQWLLEQSAQFRAGFDAAALCEQRDKSQTADWLRGFDECARKLDQGN
jgi:hypothetical protein